MKTKLSLVQIESELNQLLDLRSSYTESELGDKYPAMLLDDVDRQIDEYLRREVAKVNGIAWAITAYEAAANFLKDRADRLYKRSKQFTARADRIRERTLFVMRETLGDKAKLETPEHTLRVQKNGGKAPLITGPTTSLPDTRITQTVTLDLASWGIIQNLAEAMAAGGIDDLNEMARCNAAVNKLKDARSKLTADVDNALVRADLESGIEYPGWKIADRGYQLRVE